MQRGENKEPEWIYQLRDHLLINEFLCFVLLLFHNFKLLLRRFLSNFLCHSRRLNEGKYTLINPERVFVGLHWSPYAMNCFNHRFHFLHFMTQKTSTVLPQPERSFAVFGSRQQTEQYNKDYHFSVTIGFIMFWDVVFLSLLLFGLAFLVCSFSLFTDVGDSLSLMCSYELCYEKFYFLNGMIMTKLLSQRPTEICKPWYIKYNSQI